MTPFIFTFASFLTLALVPGGQALVRFRNVADTCGHKCRPRVGWPGHSFSNDAWGTVMNPELMSDMTSSVAAIPTGSVLPYGAGGVEASPSSCSGIVSTASGSPLSVNPASPVATSHRSHLSNSSTINPSGTRVSTHVSSTASSPPPPTASPSLSPSISPSTSTPSTSSSFSKSSVSNSVSATTNADTAIPTVSTTSGSTSGPTSSSDIQAYLTGHNTIRSQHGADPLIFSEDLAAKAQQWANGCVFQHSGGALGALGENLAAGTGTGYGISEAIKSWTDEASQYDGSNPVPSHFTQVVWKATTQVGCAVQDCDGIFPPEYGKAHYYVCEYSPQGNVIGEFGANVQA